MSMKQELVHGSQSNGPHQKQPITANFQSNQMYGVLVFCLLNWWLMDVFHIQVMYSIAILIKRNKSNYVWPEYRLAIIAFIAFHKDFSLVPKINYVSHFESIRNDKCRSIKSSGTRLSNAMPPKLYSGTI